MSTVIEEFNAQYSHGLYHGKDRIWDGENFLTLADFRSSTLERFTVEEKKRIPHSSIWLSSKKQNRFKRVIFDPEKETGLVGDELNLYKGLAYPDKPGDWELFRLHILRNICKGNVNHYEYLIQLMASIIQRPWAKDGVAIVIRGGKGTGKGVFAEMFGHCFGPYFRETAHAYSLTSHFNADFKDCIVLNVDEGYWESTKKGEGYIKNLITQDHLLIEPKGREKEYIPNSIHLIFTTNNDWAVPVSADERRYYVLDCGNGKQKDSKYFLAIMAQMKAGGYSAMIHDLLAVEITLDLTTPPTTKGLKDQQLFSEPAIKQWLREWVDEQDVWPEWLVKQTAWLEFTSWCKENRNRDNSGKLRFYSGLEKYIPLYREVHPMSMHQRRSIVLPTDRNDLLKHLDSCV